MNKGGKIMKFKTWVLWLFPAACFTLVGIFDLYERKVFRGILFIILGLSYITFSFANFKNKDKCSKKSLSKMELQNLNKELISLINQGEKVKAVKEYRIATGAGLVEAKEYVDLLIKKE